MSPLPGQRSVQPPLRAMTSSQRAIGRAAQASAGGLVGPVGIAFVDGFQYDVDLSAHAGEQAQLTALVCGCAGRCTCPRREDDNTALQERQD